MKKIQVLKGCKGIRKIKAKALKLGFDKIDFSKYYKLVKLESKTNSYRYIPTGAVLGRGELKIAGDSEHIWVVLCHPINWAKTSPVEKLHVSENKIMIETLNSIYSLELLDD